MNIGLDARTIFSPRPRGTGRNLFDAYRLIPALRPAWRFTLYHQRDPQECPLLDGVAEAPAAADRGAAWPPNVRARRINMPGDRFDTWFQFRLPLGAWHDRIDLLHLPANAAPAWCPVPCVVTIHDLIPLKVAGELPRPARRRFYRGIARAVRRATHIITPSQATRDDLQAEFGVPAERVTVIPWAPDRAVLDQDQPQTLDDLRRRWNLTKPWLLNFSGSTRRKNATGLIEALACVSPELRAGYHLVIVGCHSAAVRAKLMALAERRGVAADCRMLGFVPHEDLPGLLRGARGLVMPSLCEGFGLPILDAFACGVPVLTSQCSSMPEVAGDAAVYCDPTSPESIAAGIVQLLRDEVAESIARRGSQRVQSYTWARTAEAMCAVYERCLEATRRRRPTPATPVAGPEACEQCQQ